MASADPTPSSGSGAAPVAHGALGRWLAVHRHPAVWCTAALLAGEGLALLALAVVGVTDLLPGHDRVVSVAIALTLTAAAAAWLMLAAARAVTLGRAWVRGPVITVQVLAGLVGASFLQGGTTGLGLGLLVVASMTLVCLLSGPVSRFTGRRTYSLDQD